MEKNWVFGERLPADLPLAQWAEELCISPRLLGLLWRRGFRDRAAMDNFLSARLGNLTPPDSWPFFPEAADVLARELLAGRKIAVWGDYDVDGVTATSLCLDVLEAHGFAPLYHLPVRDSEGYGLNCEHIDILAEQGVNLLLTVDCGISDVAAVAHAREKGMTVVVSDHHLPPPDLPPAHALCNPRLASEVPMPCEELAGVGVAFYLMAALNARLAPHTGKRYRMDDALDLVALGTLADLMLLTGENRILVRGGLQGICAGKRPGMAALKEACDMGPQENINSGQVAFKLAPRINAAGRMGEAELALQCLRAPDHASGIELARRLNSFNDERRAEEDRIHGEALAQAEAMLAQRDWPALVLFGADWHPGVIGIVASRIVDKYYRPVIILCEDKGQLKGSGRSTGEFDLHAGLVATADCLLGFGGHRAAAGLRLERSRLEDFREAFSRVVGESLGTTALPAPTLQVEEELTLGDACDYAFIKELALLEPLGSGNSEPVFVSPPVVVKRHSWLGRSQEHVLLVVEDTVSKVTLRAKFWRKGAEYPPPCLEGQTIRLAYTPEFERYNNVASVVLAGRDIHREAGPGTASVADSADNGNVADNGIRSTGAACGGQRRA